MLLGCVIIRSHYTGSMPWHHDWIYKLHNITKRITMITVWNPAWTPQPTTLLLFPHVGGVGGVGGGRARMCLPLKQKCCNFDEIFITGCTESCHFDNFLCSHWWEFHQNDNISFQWMWVIRHFGITGSWRLVPIYRYPTTTSSSNLQWFDLKTGHWDCSCNDDHQGGIPDLEKIDNIIMPPLPHVC